MAVFFIAVMAALCFWGMMCDSDRQNRNNFSSGFNISIAGIVLITLINALA